MMYLKSGAIWTSMVRTYESNGKIECEVVFGQDSNSNELNIFWLVPQYVIITMSEVSSTKPKSYSKLSNLLF